MEISLGIEWSPCFHFDWCTCTIMYVTCMLCRLNKLLVIHNNDVFPCAGHDGRKVPQLSSETRYTLSPVANVALAPALMAYKTQTPSLPLVSFMEHIAVRIRTKWRFFGIMLDIPADVLDSFPAHDCLQCFSRVFDYWARRGSPQVSWETVVSILDSETVDEKSLAAEIRKAFLPSLLVRPDCDSRRDLSTYGHSNSAHSSRSSDNGYASNTSNSSMMVSDV